MRFLYILTFTIFFGQNVFAQLDPDLLIEIEKNEFRIEEKKDGFKEAWKDVKTGNFLYEDGSNYGFEQALEYYISAYRYNPYNAELNYRIGVCFIKSVQKVKSLRYFEKAFEMKQFVSPNILYMLGMAYQYNYEFEKAIKNFKEYGNVLSPQEYSVKRRDIEKRIKECENAIELVQKKERVFIDNIGNVVNSKYPDYSPLINADGSVMIFTSRRPDTQGEEVDPYDDLYYEDIYITELEENGKWGSPKNMGKPVNTNKHDATIGFSPDGQKLLLYKRDDIYISEQDGDEWSKPDALPNEINSDARESDASFSVDGRKIYFASENPENNFGGFDIFVSTKDAKGKWGEAKNIGGTINTIYDDRSVFMHPDGRTLYFASKGHNSMGGFDMFKTYLQDDLTWSKPENLGYPINTPDDDIFLVIVGSGKIGYYSSAKEGGYGEKDIYKITFLGPEKPLLLSNEDNLLASQTVPQKELKIEPVVEVKTVNLTILKGTVKDAITLEPLHAALEIVDNDKNEVLATFQSNKSTGKFLLSLPSGKNYGIAVKADNYLFHSENFDIPKSSSYQEFKKDVLLNKIEVGKKIVLNNIFFEVGKATLKDASTAELDRVVKLMEEEKGLAVEISGHTDNTGSKQLNVNLSNNRAKAVVDYLVKKGIDAARLSFKGYADNQPVADNNTIEGRALNRRVEFKILSTK